MQPLLYTKPNFNLSHFINGIINLTARMVLNMNIMQFSKLN